MLWGWSDGYISRYWYGMKFIKILLLSFFGILSIACLSTGFNVGFFKSSLGAIGFVVSGILFVYPLGISQDKVPERDVKMYQVGFFGIACGVFIITAGFLISEDIEGIIKSVVTALVAMIFGFIKIVKSKNANHHNQRA